MSRLLQLVTEPDNATLCPVRVIILGVGVPLYHAFAGYALIARHLPLDFAVLGLYVQHMCTLGGTLAASLGAKSLGKADAR